MAKYSSASGTGFFVNGYNFVAAVLQGFSVKIKSPNEPAFGMGDSWEKVLPSGVQGAEVTQNGAFFDDTAVTGMHTALGLIGPQQSGGETPQSVPVITCIVFMGNIIGRLFYGVEGVFITSSEPLSVVGKIAKENVTHTVNGKVEQGVILHADTTETGAGDTTASSVDRTTQADALSIPITSNSQANPTVVTTTVPHKLTSGDTVVIAGVTGSSPTIAGERIVTVLSSTTFSVPVDTSGGTGGTGGTMVQGKSQNGGAAYLQVLAVTLGGYDSWAILELHSTDNITFVTAATFVVTVAAQTAQRVAIAGTIRRYTATSHALNGSGSGPSIEYFAGLVRY